MQRILSFAVIAAMTVSLVGCGVKNPETVPITGQITLEGQPLAGAQVTLHMKRGEGDVLPRKPSGKTDDSGNVTIMYVGSGGETLEGAPAGEYTVTVQKVKDTGQDPNQDPDEAQAEMMKGMQGMKKTKQGEDAPDPMDTASLIPTKYGQPPFSPFKLTITEGENAPFKFDLKKKFPTGGAKK